MIEAQTLKELNDFHGEQFNMLSLVDIKKEATKWLEFYQNEYQILLRNRDNHMRANNDLLAHKYNAKAIELIGKIAFIKEFFGVE